MIYTITHERSTPMIIPPETIGRHPACYVSERQTMNDPNVVYVSKDDWARHEICNWMMVIDGS